MIELDENEVKEKLKGKMEAAEEGERRAAEQKERLKELESDILTKIASYEHLPKREIMDEVPFDAVQYTHQYYLKWNVDQMYVAIKELARSGNIIEDKKLTVFFETMAASEEMLLKLKKRIPGFMEYIYTKI